MRGGTSYDNRSIGFARLNGSTQAPFVNERFSELPPASTASLFVRLVDMKLYWPRTHRCVRGPLRDRSNLRSLPSRKAALLSLLRFDVYTSQAKVEARRTTFSKETTKERYSLSH